MRARASHSRGQAAAPWHVLDRDAVLDRLGSHGTSGLRQAEARARLQRHGPNELETRAGRGWVFMLASQFTDFMILVLLAAALVAGIVGEPQDSIVIVVIVVLNAAVGFIQEYRAERAMASLRRLAGHHARVVRDGDASVVDAATLVPGDLVWLEAGDVVPADIRILEAARLQTEEAALTGESLPVEKDTAALTEADVPIGDRTGMVYKGTLVTAGRGRGIVVATGMRTELGRLAALLSADEGRTPLQRRLAAFGRRLAVVVLAICAILFLVGWLRGEPPMLMFLTAVSLAVAAIPEALPAVVTVSLALGAARLVRRNALIRKLPAVEALGSVTYICADKTGTLTENRMKVESCYAEGAVRPELPKEPAGAWMELRLAMALCNDACATADGDWAGDPTETALLAALPGGNVAKWRGQHPRIGEIPFEARRARMSTVHAAGEGVVIYTKGAPEAILPRCIAQQSGGREVPLGPEPERVLARMATGGQRVLAFARRRLAVPPGDSDTDPEVLEKDLVFLGLVGLLDPPRPEAAPAVAACLAAGITPVMITGDHPATAVAIAARIGLASPEAHALTGRQIARLSPGELAMEVRRIRVYARVNPEQKIRIVEALQQAGELVAMTGDGVNDAPALKRADIGVAMGRIGTDVAREAAAMTLLDDNFATIVATIREGRRIFDNIRKFVKYTMTSNSGEIWTLFLAPVLGLPIPLLPIHILWINLVTDGLPGLALAGEPAERRVMQRPPRPPTESIFAGGMWQHILWVGLLMGGVSLLTQALALGVPDWPWQTMVFTVLTLSQMGHALAVRSERESLLHIGLTSNRPLLLAILLTFGLQMVVVYVPAFQPIFHTQGLSPGQLALCMALSSVVFLAVELEKGFIRARLSSREG